MNERANLIVVLAGGINPDGSLPAVAERRVATGVRLFRRAAAPRLLMSGRWGFLSPFTPPRTEAAAMKEYAVELGAAADAVLLGERAMDTIGNAFFTRRDFLEPNGWRRLVVVTSDYHLERARYTFGKLLGRTFVVEYVAAPSELSTAAREQIAAREQAIQLFLEPLLSEVPDGDLAAAEHFLFTHHPAYAKHPRLTRDEFRQLRRAS